MFAILLSRQTEYAVPSLFINAVSMFKTIMSLLRDDSLDSVWSRLLISNEQKCHLLPVYINTSRLVEDYGTSVRK